MVKLFNFVIYYFVVRNSTFSKKLEGHHPYYKIICHEIGEVYPNKIRRDSHINTAHFLNGILVF
jgi:hypothetical protein